MEYKRYMTVQLLDEDKPRIIPMTPDTEVRRSGDPIGVSVDALTGVVTIHREPPKNEVTVHVSVDPKPSKETARQMGAQAGRSIARALEYARWAEEYWVRESGPLAQDTGKVKCQMKFNKPCEFVATDRKITQPKPSAPAKPHPLQLLSDPPSVFGQSLWRPWEK